MPRAAAVLEYGWASPLLATYGNCCTGNRDFRIFRRTGDVPTFGKELFKVLAGIFRVLVRPDCDFFEQNPLSIFSHQSW